MSKLKAFFSLMRPANLVTSVADVLAGIAISGYVSGPFLGDYSLEKIVLLCLSTIGLYGGGVVFNDVFDARLDSIERPERPIPRGIVTVGQAAILGGNLLLLGIVAAAFCNATSGMLSICISIAALVYDKWGKHHPFAGPLNMGLCRGLNLLLGISILPPALSEVWFLAFVPVIYIASITMISRGEVHGGKKTTLYFALALYLLVIALISVFAYGNGYGYPIIIFLMAFAWMIMKPLFKAIDFPTGPNIGKAVKAGVISIILMDASWAAASGAPYLALLLILLLPLSLYLARLFAVT